MDNNYKELILKVKVDSYKAISNYIHNELKITKQDVEDAMKKMLISTIVSQISDGKLQSVLGMYLERAVNDSVARLSKSGVWDINKNIDIAIEKAIGDKILQIVKEKLKNMNIKDMV